MRITDAAHLALMLAALAVSYLVPFELLLLSYVVLGPAHYATEISWLHDRKYFLPHVGVAVFLALVAIAAASLDTACRPSSRRRHGFLHLLDQRAERERFWQEGELLVLRQALVEGFFGIT